MTSGQQKGGRHGAGPPGRPAAPDVRSEQNAAAELVSVIVPARNEERSIGATLDALRRQDYRNLQIIVVDGGSTDGTVAWSERHMAEDPRVELVHNPRQITPVALNVALAQARGPWLVRMDAHSTVDPGYVSAAVARLREGRWGGVGGRKDGDRRHARRPGHRRGARQPVRRRRLGLPPRRHGAGGRPHPVRGLSHRAGAQARRMGRAAHDQPGLRVRLPAAPERRAAALRSPRSGSPGRARSRCATSTTSTGATAGARWTSRCCTPARCAPGTSCRRCSCPTSRPPRSPPCAGRGSAAAMVAPVRRRHWPSPRCATARRARRAGRGPSSPPPSSPCTSAGVWASGRGSLELLRHAGAR